MPLGVAFSLPFPKFWVNSINKKALGDALIWGASYWSLYLPNMTLNRNLLSTMSWTCLENLKGASIDNILKPIIPHPHTLKFYNNWYRIMVLEQVTQYPQKKLWIRRQIIVLSFHSSIFQSKNGLRERELEYITIWSM